MGFGKRFYVVVCRMIRIIYSVCWWSKVQKKNFFYSILKRYYSYEFSIFHGGEMVRWLDPLVRTRGSPVPVPARTFFLIYFMSQISDSFNSQHFNASRKDNTNQFSYDSSTSQTPNILRNYEFITSIINIREDQSSASGLIICLLLSVQSTKQHFLIYTFIIRSLIN